MDTARSNFARTQQVSRLVADLHSDHGYENTSGAASAQETPLIEVPGLSPSNLAIHLAENRLRREQADELVGRMYGWRGYLTSPAADDPDCVTLVACDDSEPIATISVGLDSPNGLNAEELYPDVVAELRAGGARLCEFTRFAVDRAENSLELLALMFHVAFIFARRRYQGTHIVAEVNPRHVQFYSRMLGFQVCGPQRHCERVDAPAVLLQLPLEYGEQQIARYGGRPELARKIRSLYPMSLPASEVDRIAARFCVSPMPAPSDIM
ncbi:MAG: long-chain N-acyl amino acid synthase [Limnobacter sp.]|nr:long-chain N-acyl amino acid synthase [Limnobacter sp.]